MIKAISVLFVTAALLTSCTVATTPRNSSVLKYNAAEGTYEYVRVIEIPGSNADELYSAGLAWVGLNYNSATNVMKVNDENGNRIIVKGTFSVPFKMFYETYFDIGHTIVMEFKDEKARITYRDLKVIDTSGTSTGSYYFSHGSPSEKLWVATEDKIVRNVDDIEGDLKQSYASNNAW